MRLCNLTPFKVQKFFNLVRKCKGRVELISGEGDCINLQSALCQYVALAAMLATDTVPELEVRCENQEDLDMFIHFMMEG